MKDSRGDAEKDEPVGGLVHTGDEKKLCVRVCVCVCMCVLLVHVPVYVCKLCACVCVCVEQTSERMKKREG